MHADYWNHGGGWTILREVVIVVFIFQQSSAQLLRNWRMIQHGATLALAYIMEDHEENIKYGRIRFSLDIASELWSLISWPVLLQIVIAIIVVAYLQYYCRSLSPILWGSNYFHVETWVPEFWIWNVKRFYSWLSQAWQRPSSATRNCDCHE